MALIEQLASSLKYIEQCITNADDPSELCWLHRARSLIEACQPAVGTLDANHEKFTIASLGDLTELERLAAEVHKTDADAAARLMDYLLGLPGYKHERAGSQSAKEKHVYVVMQVTWAMQVTCSPLFEAWRHAIVVGSRTIEQG